jgi:hypothetical protein
MVFLLLTDKATMVREFKYISFVDSRLEVMLLAAFVLWNIISIFQLPEV